ncbi:hypothetical protein BJ912DRAFT_954888 [Pholiota molesta]|nr:hypothetical protein BJ912DRAFT_954888 [Pholiota molesta]
MESGHPLDTFSTTTQWLLRHLPSQSEALDLLPRLTTVTTVAGGFILWLVVVRALRWRRYNAIHRKYGPKWNNGLGAINPQEAQEIIHLSTVYDMPFLVHKALSFALFKTYAIPSISKLLASTKELSSKENISRRYADTDILISTWTTCPISGFTDPSFSSMNTGPNVKPAEDPRANIALARVNWMHSKYKISNSDHLYTLCLFALEAIYWSDRYGWRSLSPLEKHAFYVFWAEIGKRMNIQDIPGSIEEMMAWSKAYENTYMVPAETNRIVAGYTLDELLCPVPEAFGLRAFGVKIVVCLLDDITREAMMYKKQSWLLRTVVKGSMSMSNFVQRFLLPPRISGVYTVEPGPLHNVKPGECPRMHPNRYAARPWYRSESSSTIGYYMDKLFVKLGWFLEVPSPRLKSGGYRLEEMGPARYEDGWCIKYACAAFYNNLFHFSWPRRGHAKCRETARLSSSRAMVVGWEKVNGLNN